MYGCTVIHHGATLAASINLRIMQIKSPVTWDLLGFISIATLRA